MALAAWIFAPQCAACGTPTDAPLCPTCAVSLAELGPACPRCAEPTGPRALVCARCIRAPLPLERIAAPWRFGGELASAIRRLKFTGASHVARAVAPLWAPVLAAALFEAGPGAIVVPVPLHWRRRFMRGYDHAWLLALHACAAAGIAPPVAALRRTRAAPPQSTLPAAERRANLRGAFALRRGLTLTAPVVLVDDVVTTGATLAAAARPLLAAGVPRVLGVALARSADG